MAEENKQNNEKHTTSVRRNSWRLRPIFHSLKTRVRFTVVFTVLIMTAAAGYGFWNLNLAYHAGALRSNELYLTAVSRNAEIMLNDVSDILTWTAAELKNKSLNADSCRNAIEQTLNGHNYSAVFGVATQQGTIICSNDPVDRDALTSALARAQTVTGTVIGDVTDSESGKFIAIVHTAPDLDAAVFAIVPGDALNSELFAADNHVIGLTDTKGEPLAGLSSSEKLSVLPPAGLATEMLSRKNGSITVKGQNNQDSTYSFRPVGSFDAGRIYAFIGSPAYVITSVADQLTLETVAVTMGLFLIILWLMSTLGGLIITRRVRSIATSANRVISGEIEPGEMQTGISELGGITGLFTQMARRLQNANDTMEQKVKSRTSMLSLSKGITELQKARTEALLASIGEGVVATDTAGRISFLNDPAKKSLFWKATKTDGVPIYEAFRLESAKGEAVPKEEWPVWPAINQGETVITSAPARPFYMKRKDDTRFPVKMIISPILLNNEVVGSLIVFGDITSEVEFDQRKSEFISVASHQLRSPSTAVKFMADMMRKGDLGEMTDKQKDWVEKLYQASDAMLNMVSELLNISRVEAGVKMDPQEHDVGQFIDEIVKFMEPLLLEKKQSFELVFDAEKLPKLIFDRFSIGEVMKNLISNASKYSPEGEKVTIKIEVSDKVAFFSVRDRGMGIPKSSRDQMFNKFFRAENALNSSITGTGLGLYYCKSVTEKHGGKIGFESEEGKGSAFYFTLPVGDSPLLNGEKSNSG